MHDLLGVLGGRAGVMVGRVLTVGCEFALQRSDGFFGGLAFFEFAVVERSADGVVAELADCDDLARPVQLPVVAQVQPVPDLVA